MLILFVIKLSLTQKLFDLGKGDFNFFFDEGSKLLDVCFQNAINWFLRTVNRRPLSNKTR